MSSTGSSTPLSATSTLTNHSSTPSVKAAFSSEKHRQIHLPASSLVEWIASRSSSTIFVYDVAQQVDFGRLANDLAISGGNGHAKVFQLQTRAGAALSLVGRLTEGTSRDAELGLVLTAFTTPSGLGHMVSALSAIAPPTANGRLIIQVPTVTSISESLSLSPTTGPLGPTFALIPQSFLVILSSTPQETVDISAIAYTINTHVIHIFDHHGAAREVCAKNTPALPSPESLLTPREALGKAGYAFFDYAGDPDAEHTFVLLNGPLAQALKLIVSKLPGVGVVVVRVLRPWNEDLFKAALPPSTRFIHVFDDVSSEITPGPLYQDVLSSIITPESKGTHSLHVQSHRFTPNRLHQFLTYGPSLLAFISDLVPLASPIPPSLEGVNQKKLFFFSTPQSSLFTVPNLVIQTFLSSRSVGARLLTNYDEFAKPGGVALSRVLIFPQKDPEQFHVPLDFVRAGNGLGEGADFIAVTDQALIKTQSIFSDAKPGTALLVFTTWSSEELILNIPPSSLFLTRQNNIRLYLFNTKSAAEHLAGPGRFDDLESALAHLAIIRLYLGSMATGSAIIEKLGQDVFGSSIQAIPLCKVVAASWDGLCAIVLPEEVDVAAPQEGDLEPGKEFHFNATSIGTENARLESSQVARIGKWHDAAKSIIFREALTPNPVDTSNDPHEKDPSLRPDVSDRTYLVTCSVNRRLTPTTYNRNVFHVEFDTSGTGLKYAIGEALGVYGWNNEDDVLDFCAWYGVDPKEVISVPVPGSDGTARHTRTVFQALQQQIDIFGRPPKSFYAELASYATRREDQMTLLFIAAPEGSATFKKLSEVDTVHFADILKQFGSARPGIGELCELVGDIKPRHYSIASAQSAVGDQVDLLVVTVDWVTPNGSPRYGQCTRYLADLKVGQKVTVSIKPSVMKLPPDNMQPIIMAGLGTGAAPFRAFIQHRAHLAAQSIPVGPLIYYFGSRHRSEEYLYGEEIEAYIADKIITHAGLAFSRDQKKKIYIQHKMQQDAAMLVRMLAGEEKGVFYLCGPTWPVPDVYETLVGALIQYHGKEKEEAGQYLEDLKEEERYVLEVY